MKKMQRNRRGAILPLVAVVIVILFVAAAFSIDIAHIHMTRAELRTATDAAARAGAEALGRLQSEEAAIDAAIQAAAMNRVAGKPLTLNRNDIELGRNEFVNDDSFRFVPGSTPINAIRVVGDRSATSADGSVNLLFAKFFGVTEFQPLQTATAARLDRDIALVLDVSGSMGIEGRFDALKNALSVFLSQLDSTLEDDRVSLTVYSSQATKLVPLTEDLDLIRTEFAKQSPSGATAIGSGMQLGLQSLTSDPLRRRLAAKTIILMTDGNHNTGINPTKIAKRVAKRGAVCHTITFSAGANQTLMKEVANEAGGGIHLHADNDQQLIDAFREIALTLPVLLTK